MRGKLTAFVVCPLPILYDKVIRIMFCESSPIDVNKYNLENHIYLIIPVGSIDEQKNMNGIAHLVEHIIILKLMNEKNIVSVSGVTNFDKTVFNICSNNYFDGNFFVELLDNVEISQSELNICKSQVQREIEDLGEKLYLEYVGKYSYLSNGKEIKLPIGNKNDILGITLSQISLYIRKFYKKFMYISIWNGKVEQKIYNITSSISSERYDCYISKYLDKRSSNLKFEIYFSVNFQKNNLKYKGIKNLFQIFIEDKLNDFFKRSNYKTIALANYVRICKEQIYFNITFNLVLYKKNEIYSEIEKVLDYIQKIEITNSDIIRYNLIAKEYINNIEFVDNQYIANQFIDSYLYDYPILLSNDSFNEFIEVLNTISVNDVIIFRDKLFENTPKVVVTNADNLEDRNAT